MVIHKTNGFTGKSDGQDWRNGKVRVPKIEAQELIKKGHFCDALGKAKPIVIGGSNEPEKPKSNSVKKDIIAYLEFKKIDHDPSATNKDLLALIKD